MAEDSGISWTDNTHNPWIGCTKVSQACKYCYAETLMDTRYGKVQWGPSGNRVMTSDSNWNKPIKWNKEAVASGVRRRVFCASLADVFEDWNQCMYDHKGGTLWVDQDENVFSTADRADGPGDRMYTMQDARKRLFDLIDATPGLDWLLLTKRPENIRRMIENVHPVHTRADCNISQAFRQNVWLGTTVEDQECAEYRVPKLLECSDLAPVLFLSCEPLLGPVDLTKIRLGGCYEVDALRGEQKGTATRDIKFCGRVNWVIAGGESGAEARPSHPDWFRSLRDQCAAANVPYHFKQWGEWVEGDHECVKFSDEMKTVLPWHEPKHENDTTPVVRVGVARAGRMLDGVLHDAFPTV